VVPGTWYGRASTPSVHRGTDAEGSALVQDAQGTEKKPGAGPRVRWTGQRSDDEKPLSHMDALFHTGASFDASARPEGLPSSYAPPPAARQAH
jgi:hypothetical protein